MNADQKLAALTRGCLECHTREDLRRKLESGKKLRIKLGVDPTSSDLHLGHTVVLSRLRAFQDQGHTAVLIIGDFTARVGDPSGRDTTRPPLSAEDIRANAATYRDQAFKILDPARTEMRQNSEWLDPFVQKELFSAMQRYTVGQLLQREDFAARNKAGLPITLLEILYPIFQGYDSVAAKADVELGGSDQLFNLLMGRTMQKDSGQEPQVAMTLPLLVGLDGVKKMSKSYGNTIALTDSPRDIFGKVMRVSDPLMIQYYELLTQQDMKVIKAMHPMEAKKALAVELTARFYGDEVGARERENFDKTFSQKELPANWIPVGQSPLKWRGKARFSQILFELKYLGSVKTAQRLIEQGGFKINGEVIRNDIIEWQIWEPKLLNKDCVFQVGKSNFYKLHFGEENIQLYEIGYEVRK